MTRFTPRRPEFTSIGNPEQTGRRMEPRVITILNDHPESKYQSEQADLYRDQRTATDLFIWDRDKPISRSNSKIPVQLKTYHARNGEVPISVLQKFQLIKQKLLPLVCEIEILRQAVSNSLRITNAEFATETIQDLTAQIDAYLPIFQRSIQGAEVTYEDVQAAEDLYQQLKDELQRASDAEIQKRNALITKRTFDPNDD